MSEPGDKLRKWRDQARVALGPEMLKARKCLDFYEGEQWSREDKAFLEDDGRHVLTNNRILPTVNTLCGLERQARRDVRVTPLKEGSATIAAALTAMSRHTLNESGAQFLKSDVFRDGVVARRGFLGIRLVPGAEDRYDVEVERLSPFDVFEDPTCPDMDLNRGRYVLVRRRPTLEEAEVLFAESGAAMREPGGPAAWLRRVRQALADWVHGALDASLDGLRGEYRVEAWECWWREALDSAWFVDVAAGSRTFVCEGKGLDEAANVAESAPEAFELRGRRRRLVLHTATLVRDEVVLSEVDPFRGFNGYPVTRFSAYYFDEERFGVVDNLISPQEEENKRRSSILDHLNRSANSGWIEEEDATPKGMLEEFGSRSGQVIRYRKGRPKPERIEPVRLSQGHLAMAQIAGEDIKEISGVNRELLGYQMGSGTPAAALQLQQRSGATVQEVVFDNWDAALRLSGRTLVEIIRHCGVYSAEEMEAIIGEEEFDDPALAERAAENLRARGIVPPQEPPAPSALAMQALTPEDRARVEMAWKAAAGPAAAARGQYEKLLGEEIRAVVLGDIADIGVGEYSVAVTEAATAPTQRAAQFAQLMAIAEHTRAVPPDILIEASDVPDKEKILERLRAQQTPSPQGAAVPIPAGISGQPVPAGIPV